MEDALREASKYVAGALVALVFTFILDMLAFRDKTGDAERARDKEDACNGVLRGKDAANFHSMVEATNKEVRRQEAECRLIKYTFSYDENRRG